MHASKTNSLKFDEMFNFILIGLNKKSKCTADI